MGVRWSLSPTSTPSFFPPFSIVSILFTYASSLFVFILLLFSFSSPYFFLTLYDSLFLFILSPFTLSVLYYFLLYFAPLLPFLTFSYLLFFASTSISLSYSSFSPPSSSPPPLAVFLTHVSTPQTPFLFSRLFF